MSKPIFIFITFSLLTSCFRSTTTFDKDGAMEKLGIPIKIEYFKKIPDSAFRFPDTANFVITGDQDLRTVITEIKNADNPEPWKGAGWNQVKIHYPDTVILLFTDNIKIGRYGSGSFYYLDKENFITRRLKDK